jgi:hypothetical protein
MTKHFNLARINSPQTMIGAHGHYGKRLATAVLITTFTIIQGSNYALCVKVARRRKGRGHDQCGITIMQENLRY